MFGVGKVRQDSSLLAGMVPVGLVIVDTQDNPQCVIEGIAQAIPLKRLADPPEVGELAAFQGYDESSYVTGTQVGVKVGFKMSVSVKRDQLFDIDLSQKNA